MLRCVFGEGNGNPLQCSYLESPRDRGAWWAAVYGVTQSRTWLKQFSSLARCVLWPRMSSVLVNIPCQLKNVYSADVGLSSLQIFILLLLVDCWYFWVQLCPSWFSACCICSFLIKRYGLIDFLHSLASHSLIPDC